MSDPLIHYLMLSDDERGSAPMPIATLREKAQDEGANAFSTFRFEQDGNILNQVQCEVFCNFLEYMWTSTASDTPSTTRVDMRLVVPEEQLQQILGLVDREMPAESLFRSYRVLSKFRATFQQVPGHVGESKVALRMTRDPTNACINFHCDGGYASSTSQIALNDPSEYSGGRLVYFVDDTLHVLERPAGSFVQHATKVLHGVTCLTEGTRKSLFVVDKYNGLGENGVIEVTSTHVDGYIGSRQSNHPTVSNCVVCHERVSDHVLIPCGHVCLCGSCVASITTCPICREHLQNRHQVYL